MLNVNITYTQPKVIRVSFFSSFQFFTVFQLTRSDQQGYVQIMTNYPTQTAYRIIKLSKLMEDVRQVTPLISMLATVVNPQGVNELEASQMEDKRIKNSVLKKEAVDKIPVVPSVPTCEIIVITIWNFTVASTEGLTATCAATFTKQELETLNDYLTIK